MLVKAFPSSFDALPPRRPPKKEAWWSTATDVGDSGASELRRRPFLYDALRCGDGIEFARDKTAGASGATGGETSSSSFSLCSAEAESLRPVL